MSRRMSGKIKWYNTKKHFGFILGNEDNREVFFHINDCQEFLPQDKMPVEFELGLDRKNRDKAINVSVCVGVCNGTNNK